MENLITSRDNPKIKEYIKLRDKRAEREKTGRFVLEGFRIVSDALRENAPVESVFISQNAAKNHEDIAAQLFNRLSDRVYTVTEEVSQKLSGTAAPQGIYAVAARLDKKPRLDKIEAKGKFLVLNRVQDPGNVGTVLRTADAVGVDGVFLCSCCDIYNPKTVRSTMGSLFRLAVETDIGYNELIAELKSRGIVTCAAVVDKDAQSLRGFKFSDGAAVVIGNEGSGLSREEAELCDIRLTIKMSGTIESLNAATAAALFLWELCE